MNNLDDFLFSCREQANITLEQQQQQQQEALLKGIQGFEYMVSLVTMSVTISQWETFQKVVRAIKVKECTPARLMARAIGHAVIMRLVMDGLSRSLTRTCQASLRARRGGATRWQGWKLCWRS